MAFASIISCKMLGCMKHKLELIPRRNINNLRYTDDITLMAESEEELKRLWIKVKGESEKTTHRTGEIFANHIAGNDLICRIYKEYFQFSNKSQSLKNKYCMIFKIVNHMQAEIPGTGGRGRWGILLQFV